MDEQTPQSKYAEVCEFLETIEQCHEAHPDEPLHDERIEKYRGFVDDLIATNNHKALHSILNTITIEEAKYLSKQIYSLKTTYDDDVFIALRNAVFSNSLYAVKKYVSFINLEENINPDTDIAHLIIHAIKHRYVDIVIYIANNINLPNWLNPAGTYNDMVLHYGTYDLFKIWTGDKKYRMPTINEIAWHIVVEAENVDILQHIPELNLEKKTVEGILHKIICIDSAKCFEALPLNYWANTLSLLNISANIFASNSIKITDVLHHKYHNKRGLITPLDNIYYAEEWLNTYNIVTTFKIIDNIDTIVHIYPGRSILNKILNTPYIVLSAKSLLSIILVMLNENKIDHLIELLKNTDSPIYKVFHANVNAIATLIVKNEIELMHMLNQSLNITTTKWSKTTFPILRTYIDKDERNYGKLTEDIGREFAVWLITNNDYRLVERLVPVYGIFRTGHVYNAYQEAIRSNKHEVVEILLKSYDYGLYKFNLLSASIRYCDEKMMMLLLSYFNVNTCRHECLIDPLLVAIERKFTQVVKYLLSIKYQFRPRLELAKTSDTNNGDSNGKPIDYSVPVTDSNEVVAKITTQLKNMESSGYFVKSYNTYYLYAVKIIGEYHEITQIIRDFIDNYS